MCIEENKFATYFEAGNFNEAIWRIKKHGTAGSIFKVLGVF
jgi:hypothetical protein